MVDWGSIGQILSILFDPDEWKKRFKMFPNNLYWILSIDELDASCEQLITKAVADTKEKNNKKMPIAVGFFGRIASSTQKINFLRSHRKILNEITENILKCKEY
jgi:hypothetical protein